MSARQVVQSFRSLVVQIRQLNEIKSSFPLLIIWSSTQSIPIKEETTVEKDWNLCVKRSQSNLICDMFFNLSKQCLIFLPNGI